MVWSTERASGTRPFCTSQRGLRGIVNSITKNSKAGIPETPSIQRQSSEPNAASPIT